MHLQKRFLFVNKIPKTPQELNFFVTPSMFCNISTLYEPIYVL